MLQKDMNTKAYIWNANTFNNRYDPKKFERINDEQYYVEMEKEISDVSSNVRDYGAPQLIQAL